MPPIPEVWLEGAGVLFFLHPKKKTISTISDRSTRFFIR
jgi:hypothetical protein